MKKARVRLGTFLVAFLMALGVMAAVATPAVANPKTNCIGRICIFPTASMTTPSYYWTANGLQVGTCYYIGSPVNNPVRGAAAWFGGPGYSVSFFRVDGCPAWSLVTSLSYSSDRQWANCTNTDLWGGQYGRPAVWVTANSPCNNPYVNSFRVNFA